MKSLICFETHCESTVIFIIVKEQLLNIFEDEVEMEACSSTNMCLLLFPLLQVTTESLISTQSHHNSQIIYNQRLTLQLVWLHVHVSLLQTPTHMYTC